MQRVHTTDEFADVDNEYFPETQFVQERELLEATAVEYFPAIQG